MIDIATAGGTVIARHRTAADGLGATIRDSDHVHALELVALASAPPGPAHRRKERIPPGPAARHAAAVLTGEPTPATTVIDLAAYEAAAKNRNTLHHPHHDDCRIRLPGVALSPGRTQAH